MKLETLHAHFLNSTGICTDTRKITKGCLFFALKGGTFNGNTFSQEALDQGASKVVIDTIRYHKNTGETILCKNALVVLQKLATFHRMYLDIPIIALTGSNGKTTTKELVDVVLKQQYKTTATLGNLNNHIGVPLTLLSMTKETEIGIVEMGANHLNEIAQLCAIAKPNYGYITNFGKAHLEGFGGIEGVIKGKSELYDYLLAKNQYVFFNGDDSLQVQKLKTSMNKVGFSQHDKNYDTIKFLGANPFVALKMDGVVIRSRLVGEYNFSNICAAAVIGTHFDVPVTKIKEAIQGYIPTNNRSQIIEKETTRITLDAYNANPSSMEAALLSFSGAIPTKERAVEMKKVAILGDMFELGVAAKKEHQYIADLAAQLSIDHVILVGENFSTISSTSKKVLRFNSFESFAEHFNELPLKNVSILIKGSRGMALERILELV